MSGGVLWEGDDRDSLPEQEHMAGDDGGGARGPGLLILAGTLALFPVLPAWAVVGLLAAEVVTRLTRTLTVRRATAEVTSPTARPQQEVAR